MEAKEIPNSDKKSAWSGRGAAVGSLIVARVVYAVNTLNISAIFFLIGNDVNAGVNGLALLTSTFYLGIGAMQVPAGILVVKWGPKKVAALGVTVSSLAVVLTSISGSLLELSTLRFIVGAGMALVFAPGVILLTRLLGRERSGSGVGLFNSANGIGGLIGLFGWILIASAIGWRQSLALGGFLGLGTAFLLVRLVPKDEGDFKSPLIFSELSKVLKDRSIILLGLGALGISVGYVLESNFMTYYLHQNLGEAPALAGLVASMIVIASIFASFYGGRVYDKIKRPKLLITISGLGLAGSLVLCAVPNVLAAVAGSIIGGATSGFGLTVAFATATSFNKARKEYEGLAVAWVNCISFAGSFWPPIVFSRITEILGYPAAWVGGAGLTILLIIPYAILTRSD